MLVPVLVHTCTIPYACVYQVVQSLLSEATVDLPGADAQPVLDVATPDPLPIATGTTEQVFYSLHDNIIDIICAC